MRRALPRGDYGLIAGGRLVAAVERKSMADLVASLTSAKLRYTLAEMAALPRAALVVEDRYSQIFTLKRVRPALAADGPAELQVRWPNVPIVYAETRPLAEEWTYRYLAAAHAWADGEDAAVTRIAPSSPTSAALALHQARLPPRSALGPANTATLSPTADGYGRRGQRRGPVDPLLMGLARWGCRSFPGSGG